MPAYDRTFSPPAPVAEVIVMHPVSGVRSEAIRGKLDTGADLTVIPETLIAELGLAIQGTVWARAYDGTYSERLTYYARMLFAGNELPAVRCVSTNRSTVLVGRNVLNLFILTLDGPRLRFQLRPSRV